MSFVISRKYSRKPAFGGTTPMLRHPRPAPRSTAAIRRCLVLLQIMLCNRIAVVVLGDQRVLVYIRFRQHRRCPAPPASSTPETGFHKQGRPSGRGNSRGTSRYSRGPVKPLATRIALMTASVPELTIRDNSIEGIISAISSAISHSFSRRCTKSQSHPVTRLLVPRRSLPHPHGPGYPVPTSRRSQYIHFHPHQKYVNPLLS